MKEASPIQMVNRDAAGLYKSFYDTLRLLHEVTDPSIIQMWRGDLRDLSLRARKLLDTGALDGVRESQMKIILSRPADQWAILAKDSRALVPTF